MVKIYRGTNKYHHEDLDAAHCHSIWFTDMREWPGIRRKLFDFTYGADNTPDDPQEHAEGITLAKFNVPTTKAALVKFLNDHAMLDYYAFLDEDIGPAWRPKVEDTP